MAYSKQLAVVLLSSTVHSNTHLLECAGLPKATFAKWHHHNTAKAGDGPNVSSSAGSPTGSGLLTVVVAIIPRK